MSRLVLVSFVVLGWTFYEMSGGTDFEPRTGPSAAVDIAKTAFSHEPAAAPARSRQARSNQVAADSLVTRVSLAGSADAAPARPAADPGLRSQVARRQIAEAGPAIARSGAAFPPAGAQPAVMQLASLDGLSGLQPVNASVQSGPQPAPQPEPEQAAAEPAEDFRQITASRVNMRMGPGTKYPVLTQLDRGDEVIVFENNGDGWLQLRVPAQGRVGWIAASLVSD